MTLCPSLPAFCRGSSCMSLPYCVGMQTTLDAVSTLGLSVSEHKINSWSHGAAKLKLQLEIFDDRLLHKEYDQYTFSNGTRLFRRRTPVN